MEEIDSVLGFHIPESKRFISLQKKKCCPNILGIQNNRIVDGTPTCWFYNESEKCNVDSWLCSTCVRSLWCFKLDHYLEMRCTFSVRFMAKMSPVEQFQECV